MKLVTIDLDRCVGCRNCELACAFSQSGQFERESSNIWVNLYPAERFVVTLACVQCEVAACLNICPRGALQRDPLTHAVVVRQDRCMGCRMCLWACPFGNIRFHDEKHIAQKCDLCEGDPECVKYCMGKALNYMEVNELPETKRKTVDQKLRKLLGSFASEKL